MRDALHLGVGVVAPEIAGDHAAAEGVHEVRVIVHGEFRADVDAERLEHPLVCVERLGKAARDQVPEPVTLDDLPARAEAGPEVDAVTVRAEADEELAHAGAQPVVGVDDGVVDVEEDVHRAAVAAAVAGRGAARRAAALSSSNDSRRKSM